MKGLPDRIVWWFLLEASVFAVVHQVAMQFFLYWRWWWFDILMHTWGGLLLALGVHALATLPHVPIRATITSVLLVALVATLGWEAFELYAGLFDSTAYFPDAIYDVLLGFTGAIAGHMILVRYTRR